MKQSEKEILEEFKKSVLPKYAPKNKKANFYWEEYQIGLSARVDCIIIYDAEIWIVEVKSIFNLKKAYLAIGQLLVYGELIKELIKYDEDIRKHIKSDRVRLRKFAVFGKVRLSKEEEAYKKFSGDSLAFVMRREISRLYRRIHREEQLTT